jgi:hypothetical protein
MSRSAVAAAATLALAVLAAAPHAQQPAARAAQTIEATATAILVDVVVRDGRGRPVQDLAAGDNRVEEDGLVPTIDTYTLVSLGSGIGIGVAW